MVIRYSNITLLYFLQHWSQRWTCKSVSAKDVQETHSAHWTHKSCPCFVHLLSEDINLIPNLFGFWTKSFLFCSESSIKHETISIMCNGSISYICLFCKRKKIKKRLNIKLWQCVLCLCKDWVTVKPCPLLMNFSIIFLSLPNLILDCVSVLPLGSPDLFIMAARDSCTVNTITLLICLFFVF